MRDISSSPKSGLIIGSNDAHVTRLRTYVVQSALEGSRSLSRWVDSTITRRPSRLPRTSAQSKADYAPCTMHQRRHSPLLNHQWYLCTDGIEARGSLWTYPITSISSGIETRFKSSQDLEDRERYVSFNRCAAGQGNGLSSEFGLRPFFLDAVSRCPHASAMVHCQIRGGLMQ
jgi:hypothetical protein